MSAEKPRRLGRGLEALLASTARTPEKAAEVTIQPLDILGVDAAILFSDILIPLEPMGVGVRFEERGPVLEAPELTEDEK